jgi:hypothetical protein
VEDRLKFMPETAEPLRVSPPEAVDLLLIKKYVVEQACAGRFGSFKVAIDLVDGKIRPTSIEMLLLCTCRGCGKGRRDAAARTGNSGLTLIAAFLRPGSGRITEAIKDELHRPNAALAHTRR